MYTHIILKRLQIYIQEEADAKLDDLARRRHASKASLIRRYVDSGLATEKPIDEDPILDLIGNAPMEGVSAEDVDRVVYGGHR